MGNKRPKSLMRSDSLTFTDAGSDTRYQTHARLTFANDWSGNPVPRLWTSSYHDGWEVDADWQPIGGRIEPVAVHIAPSVSEFVDGEAVDIDSRPVTADAIRKLPLGQILGEARLALRGMAELRDRWNDAHGTAPWPDDIVGPGVDLGKPKRGQELSHDDLEAVAEVYRAAWASEQPVNEAVRRAFHLSKDGAAKRIGKARAAGLLDGIGPKR